MTDPDTADLGLRGTSWTSLITLYLRALDARSARPVLADPAAVAAAERLGPRLRTLRLHLTRGDRYLVALRGARLDAWAAGFLARHPDATVLHLGCGLDARAARVPVPATATWVDVDVPAVVAARRAAYPDGSERPAGGARHLTVEASVTDPRWWDAVPAGGPVLAIAEGLLMYLPPEGVRGLLAGIVDRYGGGELLADVVSARVVTVSGLMPPPYRGFGMRWAARDARDVERLEPRLHLVDAVPVPADRARVPSRLRRAPLAAMAAVPVLRDSFTVLRARF